MVLRLLALFSTVLCASLMAPKAFTSDIEGAPYAIYLVVYNSYDKQKNLTYTTEIAYRGILLGAMRRLQETGTFKMNGPNFPQKLLWKAFERRIEVVIAAKVGTSSILVAIRCPDTFVHIVFTIREDPNYGPFLVSVNGVAGNDSLHTYWELLVELLNGTTIRPDVGVGCYIPNPNDKVILKFTTW